MIEVWVEGVGLYGPGLEGWAKAASVLAGEAPYEMAPCVLPALDLLPPAERRRTIPTVKLALVVAQAALLDSGFDPQSVATVFATSGGDGATFHNILETLTTPERQVSPTRFHNSVHNAPAGYWAIATGCREPSTTLCAHDWSFAAGLLEAAVQAVVEERPVALIAYDVPYLEPLHSCRPIEGIFGAGFVLSPGIGTRPLARLAISRTTPTAKETEMNEPDLEFLRRNNPAARSLPFLKALSQKKIETLVLANAAEDRLELTVRPIASTPEQV